MRIHLHCSLGWIWNHHGDTPLCVFKSVSRKAEQSMRDPLPGLGSKTEHGEELTEPGFHLPLLPDCRCTVPRCLTPHCHAFSPTTDCAFEL